MVGAVPIAHHLYGVDDCLRVPSVQLAQERIYLDVFGDRRGREALGVLSDQVGGNSGDGDCEDMSSFSSQVISSTSEIHSSVATDALGNARAMLESTRMTSLAASSPSAPR